MLYKQSCALVLKTLIQTHTLYLDICVLTCDLLNVLLVKCNIIYMTTDFSSWQQHQESENLHSTATVSIAYSSSRNMVYRVLDGASFRNNDSGGDVLAASVAVTACFVSVSTSGSFGMCPAGTAAESSACSGAAVSSCSFCSYNKR